MLALRRLLANFLRACARRLDRETGSPVGYRHDTLVKMLAKDVVLAGGRTDVADAALAARIAHIRHNGTLAEWVGSFDKCRDEIRKYRADNVSPPGTPRP